MVIGISTFHPKDINWSYRYLGNDALNQIKTNKKNSVFNSNQNMLGSVKNENTDDSKNGMPAKKLSQPPRNIMDVSTDMRAILMYSARKILQTQSQNTQHGNQQQSRLLLLRDQKDVDLFQLYQK